MPESAHRVKYEDRRAIIRLIGEIENDVIFWLSDEIDHAIGYMCYDRVDIHIDSPGGAIDSLDYFLTRLEQWRRDGLVLGTLGLTTVASAAAVILSLGSHGHRRVYPSARLLYHDARIIDRGAVWTRDRLHAHERLLHEADRRLTEVIAQHILAGYPADRPLRIRNPLDGGGGAVEVNDTAEMVRVLAELSAQDRFITPEAALDMHLIDRIESAELSPTRERLVDGRTVSEA
jgi:ATP-dependent protease ClpP protease subunit